MIYVVPVNIPEERLVHDLLSVGWPATKTSFRLAGQKLLQHGNRVAWHVDRIKRLIRKNRIVDFVLVLTTEWRLLEKHLVY